VSGGHQTVHEVAAHPEHLLHDVHDGLRAADDAGATADDRLAFPQPERVDTKRLSADELILRAHVRGDSDEMRRSIEAPHLSRAPRALRSSARGTPGLLVTRIPSPSRKRPLQHRRDLVMPADRIVLWDGPIGHHGDHGLPSVGHVARRIDGEVHAVYDAFEDPQIVARTSLARPHDLLPYAARPLVVSPGALGRPVRDESAAGPNAISDDDEPITCTGERPGVAFT